MLDLNLQLIYPNATTHPFPSYEVSYLSVPIAQGYLWIDKTILSPTEIQLLQQLSSFPQEQQLSSWGNYLLKEHMLSLEEGAYRIIQVSFQQKRSVQITKWQQAVYEFFQGLVDCFFLTDHYAILVEKQQSTSLQQIELESLFLALDGDFDTYSKVFIGCFYPASSPFYSIFQEEEHAFMYSLGQNLPFTCMTLPKISLTFYLDPTTTSRDCLTALAATWIPDDATKTLLTTLWQQQGNLSATAKKLFMHRNTIQYQVEKFQTITQLNLKEMDDLFFTQLLVNQL